MASNQPSSSNSTTTVHTVRVPKDRKKRYRMMKFSSGSDVDFVKLSQTSVKLERENNLKEYKTAYGIDQMPKFGAGSEYGREQKEEARRKKYGIQTKKYNPEDQPYIMKIGKGKEMKKLKGVREGTITDNTSYYIFTQCADNAFEAIPVEEWYTFTPMIKYKYLNAEEAEEEFNKRDKIMNYFNIMARPKKTDEEEDVAQDEEEKVKTKSKAKKKEKTSFFLTEDDEIGDMGDNEDDDDEEEKDEDDDEGSKSKRKGKENKKKNQGKSKRTAKHNSDEEAVEESDEGDFDDKELDYITDSSSEEEMEDREKKETYEEKGVAEEHGLRKLIDSEDESEEEEEEKKSDKEEEVEKKEKKEKKKDGSESSSSSSSSDSDSDIEKDETLTSAIFMQKHRDRKSPVTVTGTGSGDADDRKASKRKMESEESAAKKIRTESPSLANTGSSPGITEEAIRRYLMRKPMTAKELLAKFSNKKLNMTKEQMTNTLASLLKKINPERKNINKMMYLMLKKPE